jgi:DNA-binding MarR family transcriptional regulator
MRMTSEDSPHTQESQDVSPRPTASEVVMTLIATSHRLQRVFNTRLSSQARAVSLSGPRLRLLLAVEEVGRLRMGDLAEDLGVTARTVTTLVDALEREGFLARLPDPTDRRATLLELTEKARTQFEQVRSLQMELGEELVAPLDTQQRRQLLDLLGRLNKGVVMDEEGRGVLDKLP